VTNGLYYPQELIVSLPVFSRTAGRLVAAALLLSILPAGTWAGEIAAADKAIICAERATCQVIAVTDAGQGAQGEKLSIADLVFGLSDLGNYAPEEGCRSTESGEADGGREIWLLAEGARPVKLLSLCNDGYGAAGIGFDDIAIGDNLLTHTQSGGSAWRWDTSKTYQLSPLRLVGESDCSYHNAAPNTAELTIVDRRNLEARAYAPAPRADWKDAEIGCPIVTPDFAKPLVAEPAPDVVAGYAVPVPFDVNPSPLGEGTTLGSCALALGTDGSRGFLVHGKAATADEAAEMRVIAETSKSLLIQIRDPLAQDARKAALGLSWVKEPHVEIWTASEGELLDEDSPAMPERQYHQIGINLDGTVFVGAGKPEPLPETTTWTGKDEQGRDVTVLRVSWAEESAMLYGVGIVYSQAKGGKQSRLVASAPIRKNKPLFLPTLWHNAQDETGAPGGACELSGDGRRLDL
jgi:hypothetical protein